MITKEQVSNLRIGANYLMTYTGNFHMRNFYVDLDTDSELDAYEVLGIGEGECNSTACAIGTCAVSGIASLKLERGDYWVRYSDRVFGKLDNLESKFQIPVRNITTLWDYCFSSYWSGTRKGTAADAAIRMMEVANYLENNNLVV